MNTTLEKLLNIHSKLKVLLRVCAIQEVFLIITKDLPFLSAAKPRPWNSRCYVFVVVTTFTVEFFSDIEKTLYNKNVR